MASVQKSLYAISICAYINIRVEGRGQRKKVCRCKKKGGGRESKKRTSCRSNENGIQGKNENRGPWMCAENGLSICFVFRYLSSDLHYERRKKNNANVNIFANC